MVNDEERGMGGKLHMVEKEIPIIGRKVDDQGILLARKVLAMLESGELISVAIVGEKKNGDTLVTLSPGVGDLKRLCFAADVLHVRVRDNIIGAKTAL